MYAQLWQLDAQKKLEREMIEAKEKQEKVRDTMAVLDWQKQTREQVRAQEKEKIMKEQNMLQQQWALEEQKEKTDAEQRFMLNRERNLELIQHNATEKQLREQGDLRELEADKMRLDQALARERAVEQVEQEERNERRRETQALQSHYQQQKSNKAEYERHVEELTQQENERQWNGREQQWRREDQARINLLKNVYQNRERDILLK